MFGRYCRLGIHVWASDRAVIKAARDRLERVAWYSRMHREARHAYYRAMLNIHHEQQNLCITHGI